MNVNEIKKDMLRFVKKLRTKEFLKTQEFMNEKIGI